MNYPSPWRFRIGLLGLILLAACAPRVAPPPLPSVTAEDLLQRLRAAPPLPQRFRALARIKLTEAGELQAAFKAALVLDRPHRLRVQGLGFAGVTVFDLLVTGDLYRLHLPQQERTLGGRLEGLGNLGVETLPPRLDVLARAILRVHPIPPGAGARRAVPLLEIEGGELRLTVTEADGATWWATFDDRGRPRTVTVPGEGMAWRYGDYRTLQSREYPFRVRITWGEQALEIRFIHLEPEGFSQ